MKFNRRIILVLFLGLILMGFTVHWYNQNYSENKIRHSVSSVQSCQLSVVGPSCLTNFIFNSQNNSFEFTLWNRWGRDFVVTELLLHQELPVDEIYCWLNLSNLPPEFQYQNPKGFLIKEDQRVDVILQCTEFKSSDVEKGLWLFNDTIYEIEGDVATLLVQRRIGHVRIKYYPCGDDGQEWCYYQGTPDDRIVNISPLMDFFFIETSLGLYLPLIIFVLVCILAAWWLGQKSRKPN